MITAKDVIDSSGKYPDRSMFADAAVLENAGALAAALTRLETSFGRAFELSSGFRPQHVNKTTPGAAAGSLHMQGKAADVVDDRELAVYCLSDLRLLEHFGLWLEDPRYTRVRDQATRDWRFWVHLQITPPKSGKRVFIPHDGPIPR